jgi:hypothetical protein
LETLQYLFRQVTNFLRDFRLAAKFDLLPKTRALIFPEGIEF